MTELVTPRDLTTELLRLSRLLDLAHDDLVKRSHDAASADHAYRKSRATSYVRAVGKTVGEREAQAELQCLDEKTAAHLAESLKVAALEKVRSLRAQLSATQSIANAVRSEWEVGQRYTA